MGSPTSLRALLVAGALGLTLGAPRGASAQSAASAEEVEQLKSQITALQAQVSELAAKVAALQAAPAAPAPATTPTPGPAAVAVPAGAAGAGGPQGSLTYYGNAATASKVFNPDISARGDFFLTYGPDEIGVEEAYISFPAAPGGFLLRAGKMRDAFGKVDAMHIHVLPTTDRPLVTQNLTGGEDGLADYGISLARLIPNPWLFLEATGQVYRGRSEVFSGETRSDLAYVGHLRAYRDLGDSSNVDLGGSIAYGTNDSGEGFHTRLLGVDATWRWRPLRRAIYRRFLGRTEFVWSRREEPVGTQDAFGFYVQAEYQFARRWIAGGRLDYSEEATDPSLVDQGGSLLLTWWPSEFSQIRGQYRYTHFGEGRIANEFLFQFLFSIGAHGAHVF
jgi:hypothetical protein